MGKTAVANVPSAVEPQATASTKKSAKSTSGSKVKHFVLDTNVLLHNPNSLYMFEDNIVVIPFTVLGELDKFKKNNDDTGRSSREVIRQLDRLRAKGTLAQGVQWNGHGGMVRVEFADMSNCEKRPDWFVEDTPDNRIIGVAWSLMQKGVNAVMITKDINVRLKSDALGITTEDFEAGKVDIDHLYGGYKFVDVPSEVIDQLYEEKQLDIDSIAEHLKITYEDGSVGENKVFANEFVQLRDQFDESHTGLARRLADTDHLIPVQGPRRPVYGIIARNVQQTMAMDLLLDDEIKLVTLLGMAGSGKTLLALAAGMAKVFGEQRYDKLLVARPIMPMGRDIGYLPGDKDEKLGAWMQPIFDNLTYLMSTRGADAQRQQAG